MKRFVYFPFILFALLGLFFLVLFLFAFIQIGIISVAFHKLGLTGPQVFFVLLGTLIGSAVNIPIYRTKRTARKNVLPQIKFFRHYRHPLFAPGPDQTTHQIVAVNIGGCVIPCLLSLYLIGRIGPSPGLSLAVLVVGAVCFKLARPVPGLGIGIPVLIPPLVTVLATIFLAPDGQNPQVAYIAGSLGTLLGADVLHLVNPKSKALLDAPVLSVGGAGTFDGIFLTGILAVLLT
ncbi:MAG: DUF1614 domain-containing protein [Thermodesulfobacteriota bacterium]|nr:DUF1614 domain-containing protein [Thermodesulfobacteriota bacterium]